MSRRHHGRPRQHAAAADRARPATGVGQAPMAAPDGDGGPPAASIGTRPPDPAAPARSEPIAAPRSTAVAPADREAEPSPVAAPPVAERTAREAAPNGPDGLVADPPAPAAGAPGINGQCTAPQLRRFIKSRPYVPMHELRRRFGISGGDDDVTPVRMDPGHIYVGLPEREGHLLGELLRSGEIGYELSLDPRSPIVIGVYPMRPIPRG